MRNGNDGNSIFFKIVFYVLILPMRNGNDNMVEQELLDDMSSYPTYEEWKL